MGGRARRAALVATVGVASLLGVPGPGTAVGAARPTAIAVAPDGTSYVGVAGDPTVLVLSPGGVATRKILLSGVGPVAALDVDPGGGLHVDDGSTVARISSDGAVLSSFRHGPACPAASGLYGGLEVTTSRVYVAERCRGEVGVYSRTGTRLATIDLPGTGLPRGVAWAPAHRAVPARLYVSVPDAGKVYGYDAAGLSPGSRPVVTVSHQSPSAVAADDRGHLAVLDAATNGLYLHDAERRYELFRTLGHPPTASATRGYLDRPAGLAQGGARVWRHYWVADTGNGRVQRWNTAGTTQWMADVGAPIDPPATGPTPVADPTPVPDPTPVTTCRGTPAVTIDAGGDVARDPYVELTIRAPEGAQEVEISHDGFRHVDRKPLVESCRYAWTLDGRPSRRPQVVSVRFPGVPGVARDQVVLDGTAPVIRRVGARWINARQGWVLRVRAHDRGTGIGTIRVGKTRRQAHTWDWPADIVSWDSTQLRWIQVVDRVGNGSRWHRLRL